MDERKAVVVIYLDFNVLFDKKPYIILLGKKQLKFGFNMKSFLKQISNTKCNSIFMNWEG